MNILVSTWFWVGLSVLAAVITLAWVAGHPAATRIMSPRTPGRTGETRLDHSEYVDDFRR